MQNSDYQLANAKVVYTVADLLSVLRVAKPTIYNILNSGQLKSAKVGGRRLISHESLMDFLREQEKKGRR